MKLWPKLLSSTKPSTVPSLFWLLLLVFFIAFSFGQLGRFELQFVVFYLHDVVVVLWLLLYFSQYSQKILPLIRNLKHIWRSALFFCVWVLIGLVISTFTSENIIGWLYLLRLTTYSLFAYSVHTLLAAKPVKLRELAVIAGTYIAAFGLLWYFLNPDTRYLFLFGWDEHYYRLISSLLDPNFAGILFILTGWYLFSLRRRLPIWLVASTGFLLVIALALTFSRASYLALLISLLAYFFMEQRRIDKKRLGTILAGLVVIVSVLVVAPKPGGEGVNLLRTASITARVTSSAEYLSSMEPYHYLLGQGFFNPSIENTNHAQVPDNLVVLLLVGTGIPGLITFFIFFTKLIRNVAQIDPALAAGLIAVIIHAQFNNTLFEPFIFLFIGVGVASVRWNNLRVDTSLAK